MRCRSDPFVLQQHAVPSVGKSDVTRAMPSPERSRHQSDDVTRAMPSSERRRRNQREAEREREESTCRSQPTSGAHAGQPMRHPQRQSKTAVDDPTNISTLTSDANEYPATLKMTRTQTQKEDLGRSGIRVGHCIRTPNPIHLCIRVGHCIRTPNPPGHTRGSLHTYTQSTCACELTAAR